MMLRLFRGVVVALALIATACDDNNGNVVHGLSTATVRLANNTDTPLVFTNPSNPVSNATLTFGQASACTFVDLTNSPVLTITNGTTGAIVPFTPILSFGDNVTIVAFGDTLGNVQLTALDNRFVPATNSAGLRFFNGAARTGPLVMQRNGVPLTPFVGSGAASAFVSVPIGSARITFSTADSVVLDAGAMNFPISQTFTVVVGPVAPRIGPLQSFTVQGC
jgi:hypothetical protein